MQHGRTICKKIKLIIALGLLLATNPAVSLASDWQPAVLAYMNKNYERSLALQQASNQAASAEEKLVNRFLLVETYLKQHAYQQAQAELTPLANQGSRRSLQLSATFRLAELAYQQQAYRRSLQFLGSIKNNRDARFLYPSMPVLEIKNLLKLKQIKAAEREFQAMIKRYPRSLKNDKIKLLYAVLKDYQNQLLDALELYAELTDYPMVHLLAGRCQEELGRLVAAIESYQKAIDQAQVTSHRQLAQYLKCQAFYKNRDYLAAQKSSERLLAETSSTPYYEKVKLLQLLIKFKQGRFLETIKLAKASSAWARQLNKHDQSLILLVQADAYLNVDQFEEAEQAYQQALNLTDQFSSEVTIKLAFLQSLKQDWSRCQAFLRTYHSNTRQPKPLAFLLTSIAGYATGQESAAFNALTKLNQNQQGLDEIAFHHMIKYYQQKNDPEKLIRQWTLLKRQLRKQELPSDIREVAAQVRIMVAEAYFKQGKYQLARQYFRQADQLYPYESVKAHTLPGLVWCDYKLKQYSQIAAHDDQIQRLQEINPKVKQEIALLTAHTLFNQKNYQEAVVAYQRWLDQVGDHRDKPEVTFQMGWAYYLSESYLDAIETWKTLTIDYPKHPMSKTALIWIGDTYFQAGENQAARETYQALIEAFPQDEAKSNWKLRMAQTYYNELEDKQAIYLFIEIIDDYPDTEDARQAQKGIEAASYRIADALDTIPAFQSFLSKYPDSYLAEDILYRIGAAYFQNEYYQQCVNALLDYILKFTKSGRLAQANYYILVSQEKLGNLSTARTQAQTFLQNYPEHELAPEVTFRLASIAFQQEDYASAAGWFVTCAEKYELEKYQAKAWYNAAVSYEKVKQPTNAALYYEKLIKHFPDDENVATGLQRLVQLYLLAQQLDEVEQLLETKTVEQQKEVLPKIWFEISNYYREQNNQDEQVAYLKKITASQVVDRQTKSLALIELAAYHEKRKAWKQALTTYQQLIKTATEDKWIQAAQKRVVLLKRIITSN